uniref:PICALM interacting mitotic regulator n=1 Tax=Chlorocebus sabaeus TaxID=60711 RepID=A0A0D9RJH4_CHLSB
MASRWQSMGTSVRRRSFRHQEQLEDSKELQPVASHQETSAGALGSLCRQFQRRLPLRAVNLNLCAGPSWKRLETPEPGQQGLQAAARSAKSALGAMSQEDVLIWDKDQYGPLWRVDRVSETRGRKTGALLSWGQSVSGKQAQQVAWLRGEGEAHPSPQFLAASYSHLGALGEGCLAAAPVSWQVVTRMHVSDQVALCKPGSESDSDPEPVGAGIQHLQKLSQELEEAIMAEERKQALCDRQVFVLKDVYASP